MFRFKSEKNDPTVLKSLKKFIYKLKSAADETEENDLFDQNKFTLDDLEKAESNLTDAITKFESATDDDKNYELQKKCDALESIVEKIKCLRHLKSSK